MLCREPAAGHALLFHPARNDFFDHDAANDARVAHCHQDRTTRMRRDIQFETYVADLIKRAAIAALKTCIQSIRRLRRRRGEPKPNPLTPIQKANFSNSAQICEICGRILVRSRPWHRSTFGLPVRCLRRPLENSYIRAKHSSAEFNKTSVDGSSIWANLLIPLEAGLL